MNIPPVDSQNKNSDPLTVTPLTPFLRLVFEKNELFLLIKDYLFELAIGYEDIFIKLLDYVYQQRKKLDVSVIEHFLEKERYRSSNKPAIEGLIQIYQNVMNFELNEVDEKYWLEQLRDAIIKKRVSDLVSKIDNYQSKKDFHKLLYDLKKIIYFEFPFIEDIYKRKETMDDLIERYNQFFGFKRVVPTFLPTLNENLNLGGIWKKTFNLIIAPSGYGKTTFLVTMAADLVQQGYNILFYTLEFDKKYLRLLIDKALTNKTLREIEDLYKNKNLQELYNLINEKVKGELILIDDKDVTPADVDGMLNVLKDKNINIDLVIIDYFQLLKESKRSNYKSWYVETNIARRLKEIAIAHEVVILCSAQSNKNYFYGGEIDQNLIYGSLGVIQESSLVLFLYTKQEKNEDGEKEKKYYIKVLKNRQGKSYFDIPILPLWQYSKLMEANLY